MFFPALAMATAIWLITAPFMGMETGMSTTLSVATGCAAWLLAIVGYWSRTAQRMLAVLGGVLGLANLFFPSSVGVEATSALASVVLIVVGLGPRPSFPAIPRRAATALPVVR